jgi:Nucleotidyl transferase
MQMPEAIVLAGGEDKRLNPLTSAEQPKCLLPVANSPAILYSLHALHRAGIDSVFVVRTSGPKLTSKAMIIGWDCGLRCACGGPRLSRRCAHAAEHAPNALRALQVACGDSTASKVQKFVGKEASLGGMLITVLTAASQTGSADAVRLVAPKLTGDHVVVMSGDTVTDIALASVLFTHRVRAAGITAVLSKTASSASENTKLGKAPKACRLSQSCRLHAKNVWSTTSSAVLQPRSQSALASRVEVEPVLQAWDCNSAWVQGVDYVAIDEGSQRLLTYAYSPTQLRKLTVPLAAVKACGALNVTTDMRDACIYVISKKVIEQIVVTEGMSSIKARFCSSCFSTACGS